MVEVRALGECALKVRFSFCPRTPLDWEGVDGIWHLVGVDQ